MNARIVNMLGVRAGRLTVVSYYGKNKTNEALWVCLCDCGKEVIIKGRNIRSGNTKSCGCLCRDVAAKMGNSRTTHGMSETRIYSIWCDMKRRCYNASNKEYHNYGGRGIRVCNEWIMDFDEFYNWSIASGYNENLTIDRIDVNGNYSANNCRWATISEQGRNKRLSVKNSTGQSGVTYHDKRNVFVARIGVNGKRVNIGEYKTLEDAIKARKVAEAKYWG